MDDKLFDPHARAEEKQRSREEDRLALERGEKTLDELRRENLTYARLEHLGDGWQGARLLEEITAVWFEFIRALDAHHEPALAWFRDGAEEHGVPLPPA
jgi:hypothetical protein